MNPSPISMSSPFISRLFAPLLLLVVALPTLLGGCDDGRTGLGPGGPAGLPFDIEIPRQVPIGTRSAISGTVVRRMEVVKSDSIFAINSTPAFYAQFTANDTVGAPTAVLLNGVALKQHRDTDTLRFASSSNTSVYGENVWGLGNSSDTTLFPIGQIDPMDSVQPFTSSTRERIYRSDSALVITWKRPSLPSNAVAILVRGQDTTISDVGLDAAGRYVIPEQAMARLRGRTTVIVTRYYTLQQNWMSKPVVFARLAQYRADITVQ